MNIQNIKKKKPEDYQEQKGHYIDNNSILYKYQNNREWNRVQTVSEQNQNINLLNRKQLPLKKLEPLHKRFSKQIHMFPILIEFQKFRVFNKLLGEGSYSKVFLGENKKIKQFVAIKQVTQLVENQIACLMNSQSKYIIKMYNFWNAGKYSYIALELCQSNLRESIGNCSIEEKVEYFQQIIEGMDYLNKKKIIHRDLKFQNILIKENTIKISDFGFAKPIGSKLSVISEKCGTPYTMAPQIYFFKGEGKPLYTHKCDIYSLGVILHEMLYTKHPYQYCAKRMQNNKRVQIKRNFGYLDLLIDRALQPQVYKRCNWQQFMQIFTLYRMIKAQQNHQMLQVRNQYNPMTTNYFEGKQNHPPERMKQPRKKPQNIKPNFLRYKRNIYVTPIRNKPNENTSDKGQILILKQKQNPFQEIKLSKYQKSTFNKDQAPTSQQKNKWKKQHDELIEPLKKSQSIDSDIISLTKLICLVLFLLWIILNLVPDSSK